MNESQLTRLRAIETETVALREMLVAVQVKLYALHEQVVEMLMEEFARPLTR